MAASPSSPAVGSPRAATQHKLQVGPPIDYSFKELKTVSGEFALDIPHNHSIPFVMPIF
jgi:hypothetical protein